jgi:two-component system, NarL family, invasion response regulator UvrY
MAMMPPSGQKPPASIRVLIAYEHPIVREGLRRILSRAPDMLVAGETVNGQETLDAIARGAADVVILDFRLPGKDGFEILRALQELPHPPPVLVLSMYAEGELGVRLLRAGAAGFMNKEAAPDRLLNVLRRIHRGGRYISEGMAEKMAAMFDGRTELNPHEVLSDREFQVLLRIASGRSVEHIAGEFSLSVKTVRTYRTRIHEKLQLGNDVEVTHYALRHGLIIPGDGPAQ